MNWKTCFVAVAAISTVILAGCGTSSNTTAPADNTTVNQSTNAPHTDAKTGISTMLGDIATLRQQIASGDAANSKATGEHLEATWSSFEDSVKGSYKDDYENVEKYLDPLVAATAASSLDKQTTSSLADSLEGALKALQGKLG